MKKQINVTYIDIPAVQGSMANISAMLDILEPSALEFAPWAAFPYKPDVSFVIAHTGNTILVKFYVNEKHVTSRFDQLNDPVFRDSCVEIFISFEPKKNYYNIEHNSKGTCLAGYKEEGCSLQLLNKRTIDLIRTYSVIKPASPAKNEREWELTMVIPVDFFGDYFRHSTLKGRTAEANFYKCGDDTAVPHYLSWNMVESAAPDFHLPQFFGELVFL